MDLNDYQTHCRKTAVSLNLEHMAFGLLEEAGEIAGILKRLHRGDMEYFDEYLAQPDCLTPYGLEKLHAELGDLLWYTAMLADHLGFAFDGIAKANLAKLQRRKAKDMIHGSGDDR